MSNVIITGLDIQRGKTSKNKFGNVAILDFQPIHMCSKDEKDDVWKQHVADWYEAYGWRQVSATHRKIIKNRRIVSGELDPEDYIVNPDNEFSNSLGIIGVDDNSDPLKQFYPIIPNVIHALGGEFLQKDNRTIVSAVDKFSVDERLEYKEGLFRETLIQKNISDRQAALLRMGLIPDENNEQMMQYYNQEIETAKKMAEVEASFKKFRTQAEIWGQNILNVSRDKFNLDELEKEGFIESLSNSRVLFHLDMGESSFKPEMIDNAYVFYHKSPAIKYYSEGDFLGWFQFMTLGDILSKFGNRKDFTEEIAEQLKEINNVHSNGLLLPDHLTSSPGTYYDTSKKWPDGYLDRKIVEAQTEHNVKNYLGINQSTDQLLSAHKSQGIGDPRLFRVMRLYVRSMRKIGWLTKVNRAGQVEFQDYVDEYFKTTVEPVYDNSITKAKTASNLLYGEHIDWQWVNEWRHHLKISNNMDNSFWKQNNPFEPIYLDGEPCTFQFKGQNNPYEIYPPFEGCEFRTIGTKPVSMVDRMKPWQIIYNICGNKLPKMIADDPGIVLAINRQTIPRDYLSSEYDGDIVQNHMNNIIENGVIDISTTKEQLEGGSGNNLIAPQAVNLSKVMDVMNYFQLAQLVKEEAFQTIGLNRQKVGQAKPYETAGGIQAGIQFADTQTLPYFNQFCVEFLPRFYQRLLEAAQFYSITSEEVQLSYMNSDEDNVFLEVAGKDLLRHLNVKATATPRVKQIENQLKNLLLSDNTMGIGILEKVEGLYSDTATQYMVKLRKAQFEREEKERQMFEQDQETKRHQADTQLQNAREQREHEDLQKQLDRESKERQSWINALGNTQNAGAGEDLNQAGDILNASLKQQELGTKTQLEKDKLASAQQIELNKILSDREERENKLQIKNIDYKIAKENKN